MKRSPTESDAFDLGRDLPTSDEDIRVLRRLRKEPPTLEQVWLAVAAAGPATIDDLRARGSTRGVPFEL